MKPTPTEERAAEMASILRNVLGNFGDAAGYMDFRIAAEVTRTDPFDTVDDLRRGLESGSLILVVPVLTAKDATPVASVLVTEATVDIEEEVEIKPSNHSPLIEIEAK